MTTLVILMTMMTVFSQISMEISAYDLLIEHVIVKENNIVKEENVEKTTGDEVITVEVPIEVERETTSETVTTEIITSTNKFTKETEKAKKTSQSVFLLTKPVSGGVTTSKFGDEVDRTGPHVGHDWAVSTGTKVKASAEGTVTKAYYSDSYGYNILINHGNGMQTRYAHLSKLKVEVGQHVNSGDIIGLSGSTGQSTGPHLHFEVIVNGERVDPLEYLK